MTTLQPLRVLVADDDAAGRALLADLLAECGHAVVAQVATGAEAVVQAAALGPDVVLLDVHMPGGRGTEAATLLARARPAPGVVLVTEDVDARLTDAEVRDTRAASVLPKCVSRAVLDNAVRLAAARARAVAQAQQELEAARRALEERKAVERAKGILMRRTGCSEQEAERMMEHSCAADGVPLVAVAQVVLQSEPGATPH